MNSNSLDSPNKPSRQADLATREIRACSVCGAKFSATRNSEFCPMCMLRKALAGGVESGESSASEDTVKPTPVEADRRFDHYELVTGEDGKPVELGRGAMGVTYEAFDVNLRCPVTLKVISERYLGDESARLRFFCVKCVRRQRCDIQTSLQFFILEEAARATSTPWSLWRGKRSKI